MVFGLHTARSGTAVWCCSFSLCGGRLLQWCTKGAVVWWWCFTPLGLCFRPLAVPSPLQSCIKVAIDFVSPESLRGVLQARRGVPEPARRPRGQGGQAGGECPSLLPLTDLPLAVAWLPCSPLVVRRSLYAAGPESSPWLSGVVLTEAALCASASCAVLLVLLVLLVLVLYRWGSVLVRWVEMILHEMSEKEESAEEEQSGGVV